MKFRGVEVINYCNSDGTIIPIKIRTTNDEGITQVYKIKQCNEPKSKTEGSFYHPDFTSHVTSYLDYQCVISVLGADKVIQLRYWLREHKWTFGIM